MFHVEHSLDGGVMFHVKHSLDNIRRNSYNGATIMGRNKKN